MAQLALLLACNTHAPPGTTALPVVVVAPQHLGCPPPTFVLFKVKVKVHCMIV